jgi:hypothetical protein
MRETIAWAIPILVSLFLIQTAAELLSMRASAVQVRGGSDAGAKRETIRGPVHEIDHDVTAAGIIT